MAPEDTQLAPNAQVKVLSIKEWNNLIRAANHLAVGMYRNSLDIDCRPEFHAFLLEMKKHGVVFSPSIEGYLEDRNGYR